MYKPDGNIMLPEEDLADGMEEANVPWGAAVEAEAGG